jgi:gas vesicle protein
MPEVKMREVTTAQIKGFFGGLMVGAVTGAVTMWLFAPRSGKRTRARLQHQVEELRDRIAEDMEETEEDVVTQAHQVAHDFRGKMKEFQKRGQKALER